MAEKSSKDRLSIEYNFFTFRKNRAFHSSLRNIFLKKVRLMMYENN